MFNISTPLRRRSGGPPLNTGLPEHTPKKRRTKESPKKEPAPSTEERQFEPNLGIRLEQAVEDRLYQTMSVQAPLKERIADESVKGSDSVEQRQRL